MAIVETIPLLLNAHSPLGQRWSTTKSCYLFRNLPFPVNIHILWGFTSEHIGVNMYLFSFAYHRIPKPSNLLTFLLCIKYVCSISRGWICSVLLPYACNAKPIKVEGQIAWEKKKNKNKQKTIKFLDGTDRTKEDLRGILTGQRKEGIFKMIFQWKHRVWGGGFLFAGMSRPTPS